MMEADKLPEQLKAWSAALVGAEAQIMRMEPLARDRIAVFLWFLGRHLSRASWRLRAGAWPARQWFEIERAAMVLTEGGPIPGAPPEIASLQACISPSSTDGESSLARFCRALIVQTEQAKPGSSVTLAPETSPWESRGSTTDQKLNELAWAGSAFRSIAGSIFWSVGRSQPGPEAPQTSGRIIIIHGIGHAKPGDALRAVTASIGTLHQYDDTGAISIGDVNWNFRRDQIGSDTLGNDVLKLLRLQIDAASSLYVTPAAANDLDSRVGTALRTLASLSLIAWCAVLPLAVWPHQDWWLPQRMALSIAACSVASLVVCAVLVARCAQLSSWVAVRATLLTTSAPLGTLALVSHLLPTAMRRFIGGPIKLYADVVRYLGDVEHRSRLLAEVSWSIPRNVMNGSVVFVGHSLGSIIALDWLRLGASSTFGSHARAIILMGSPLRRYMQRFFPDRYPPMDDILTEIVRRHRHVQIRNIWQPFDYVGTKLFDELESSRASERKVSARGFHMHTGYFENPMAMEEIPRFFMSSGRGPTVDEAEESDWIAEAIERAEGEDDTTQFMREYHSGVWHAKDRRDVLCQWVLVAWPIALVAGVAMAILRGMGGMPLNG